MLTRGHGSLISDPEGKIVTKRPSPGTGAAVVSKGQSKMTKFPVVMTSTTRGKDDGAPEIETYLEGETYELGPGLYRAFVDHLKCAKPVRPARTVKPPKSEPSKPARKRRTKAKAAAPENK